MARGSRKSAAPPDHVLDRLQERLEAHAAERWPRCQGVAVRKHGAFVYVDARGPGDQEPAPLCRLRYLGSIESWEFAFYTWSREAYEPSLLESGLPFGTPEECFDAAAFSMLS